MVVMRPSTFIDLAPPQIERLDVDYPLNLWARPVQATGALHTKRDFTIWFWLAIKDVDRPKAYEVTENQVTLKSTLANKIN
jgi:hypothetical protein